MLLYVESFGNPRKFARTARRLARTKPVLAMKSGTSGSGRRAASSHTAALAGSEAAVDALFRQAGVMRAQTLGELVDVAALLSSQLVPAGNRVAVVTNAGGLGILCADACEAEGLELPSRSGRPSSRSAGSGRGCERGESRRHARLRDGIRELRLARFRSCWTSRTVDAVIALFVPPVAVDEETVGAAITGAAAGAEKPVLASLLAAEPLTPRSSCGLSVPGVGGTRARARSRAGRLAAAAGGHGARTCRNRR